jgi:hypothetical protein
MDRDVISTETGTKPEDFGFIDKYFLRRLSIARRKRDHVSPAAAYTEAKVEVILLAIAMPVS